MKSYTIRMPGEDPIATGLSLEDVHGYEVPEGYLWPSSEPEDEDGSVPLRCDDEHGNEVAGMFGTYCLYLESPREAADGLSAAKARVAADPRLSAAEDLLLEYDWPNRDEHLEWVASAPVEEILDTIERLRRDEAAAAASKGEIPLDPWRAKAILAKLDRADDFMEGADYFLITTTDGAEELWAWGEDEPVATNTTSTSWH